MNVCMYVCVCKYVCLCMCIMYVCNRFCMYVLFVFLYVRSCVSTYGRLLPYCVCKKSC